MRNLTLRQLRIFVSAAKLLNFSRAAETLHITAPAVSQQIKEMENDLNCSLFKREGRSVSLTASGEQFLVYALKVLTTLDQAQQALNDMQSTYTGSLTIGLVSTTRYFFPSILAEFQKQYPQVHIRVDLKNRAQLIEQLHEGEIDLAIMGKPPTSLLNYATRFAQHPHVFIASPRHPLADKKNLSPQALAQVEIITREQGSGTRYIMENFFQRHHLNPSTRIEISGNETIKQAVIAELGISLISIHTINQEVKNQQLKILEIEGTPIMRDWYVVRPQKRERSNASDAFEDFVIQQAGTIFGQMFAEVNQITQEIG